MNSRCRVTHGRRACPLRVSDEGGGWHGKRVPVSDQQGRCRLAVCGFQAQGRSGVSLVVYCVGVSAQRGAARVQRRRCWTAAAARVGSAQPADLHPRRVSPPVLVWEQSRVFGTALLVRVAARSSRQRQQPAPSLGPTSLRILALWIAQIDPTATRRHDDLRDDHDGNPAPPDELHSTNTSVQRHRPLATMAHETVYFSRPRTYGKGARGCRVCTHKAGLIRKYGLNICRQCFREKSTDIGFVKHR